MVTISGEYLQSWDMFAAREIAHMIHPVWFSTLRRMTSASCDVLILIAPCFVAAKDIVSHSHWNSRMFSGVRFIGNLSRWNLCDSPAFPSSTLYTKCTLHTERFINRIMSKFKLENKIGEKARNEQQNPYKRINYVCMYVFSVYEEHIRGFMVRVTSHTLGSPW